VDRHREARQGREEEVREEEVEEEGLTRPVGLGRGSGAAAAVAVALLSVVVGVRLVGPGGDAPSATVQLPPGTPVFADDEILWAQDSAIHYGDRRFDVAPWLVRSMLRSDYGLLLEVAQRRGPYAPTRTVWYDGRTLTELPGDVHEAKVSPDGRYLGWIDLDGPELGHGRIAEAVVVNLRTGAELLRDHDGMDGDGRVDVAEQYAEGGPAFLGFDRSAAYWSDVVGEGHQRRFDLATGKATDMGEPDPAVSSGPRLGDSVRGWDADAHDGRDAEAGIRTGFLSPNLRWYFDTSSTGRLPVRDERSGEDVTPNYGYRWVFFGGWRSREAFYVLARRAFDFEIAPRPDGSSGVLLTCDVRSRRCGSVRRVRDLNTIVFGFGATMFGG
jgi:hypothetical protein